MKILSDTLGKSLSLKTTAILQSGVLVNKLPLMRFLTPVIKYLLILCRLLSKINNRYIFGSISGFSKRSYEEKDMYCSEDMLLRAS